MKRALDRREQVLLRRTKAMLTGKHSAGGRVKPDRMTKAVSLPKLNFTKENGHGNR